MTLQEYLTQSNPQKNVKVVLQPNEYTIGNTINSFEHGKITQVFINGLPYEYALCGSTNLLTTDKDGNPKKYSCFIINKPVIL